MRAIITWQLSISCLIFVFQTAPAGNVLRVELGVEAFLRKIGLQPLRETSSVFAGVRDGHAQWFGRGHRLKAHYQGISSESQPQARRSHNRKTTGPNSASQISRLFDADKSSVTAYCLSTSLNLTVAAPRSPCAFGPSMRHLSNNAYVAQLWPDRRTKSEAGPTFAFPRSIRTFSTATPSTSSARALAIATG